MPHSDHSFGSPSPYNTFVDLPIFPNTVPTAPLLRISLRKLLARNSSEEERCWQACCELGFFYLDLEGDDVGAKLLKDADELFEVMKGFFNLPIEEKVKYDLKEKGSYFGYKGYGEGIVDKMGTRDKNEFYNISKDDIIGLSDKLPTPSTLDTHRTLCSSYIHSSHKLCMLVTSILSSRLSLTTPIRESGGLSALHKLNSNSGDQIRFVKAPPQDVDSKAVALGEHTDFGSVTVLFNRLGGLQVRLPAHIAPDPPSSSSTSDTETGFCKDGWTYVRPLPGHAIINLGDALVKFSSGKLRSNIHRVVPSPGDQGKVTRYSLVYFCRPEDDVVLKSLVEGSEDREMEEEVTAKEWILRRALGRRKEGGWEKSGGTEEMSLRGGVKG